jgi:integration host factor subunit beta
MIKSELITKIGRKIDQIPERDVALCVKVLINKIIKSLPVVGRIEIRNFGSFTMHYRPSRLAHNPKTGEKLMTDPKYAIHFKPGKGVKERIDASKHIPIREAGEE